MKASSAGLDVKAFAANDPVGSHAMVKSGAELALKILSLPIPVVGARRGHAYPMGAFLLLAADIRIGIDTDFRIGLNEVAIDDELTLEACRGSALARHAGKLPGAA